MPLLDSQMLRLRLWQSQTEYAHFTRKTFDDYNNTCEMIDGSAAIHPYNLGLLLLRGISSNDFFVWAKQRFINSFDTCYLMPAGEVMASILHPAQYMDEEFPGSDLSAPFAPTPTIARFMAASRGQHGGRRHGGRSSRGGRGMPNMCGACGSLDHVLSPRTTEMVHCETQDGKLIRSLAP
jgi:hypothetical protein